MHSHAITFQHLVLTTITLTKDKRKIKQPLFLKRKENHLNMIKEK